MNHKIYYVMRKAPTGCTRNAWIFAATEEIFCGICLRGKVAAKTGATCGSCGSRVFRCLMAVEGGKDRPAFSAICKAIRKRSVRRVAVADHSGNLLTMRIE